LETADWCNSVGADQYGFLSRLAAGAVFVCRGGARVQWAIEAINRDCAPCMCICDCFGHDWLCRAHMFFQRTFQLEDEECVYGFIHPLQSFNPLLLLFAKLFSADVIKGE
jgi:hypothetical protein